VKNCLIAMTVLMALPMTGAARLDAQSMDDLNLQVHGYVTQGFVYTTNNSWDTTDSDKGSAAWTDAVVNLSVQPQPRLRIGVQARYTILGDYGDKIVLDWAQADYKVNEYFGFRVGDVKTPSGLLNESQDIDPAQLWVLLPQSVYPLASRAAQLDHYGGVVYGTIPLGESLGTLAYRGFGGQRVLGGDDGYFQPFRDQGMSLPNGITGRTFGGTLRWDTPIEGLTAGASIDSEHPSGSIVAGPYVGTVSTQRVYVPYYFARYERNKVMVASEYSRIAVLSQVDFPGAPTAYTNTDDRDFYVMASYKLAEKLTAGAYYSSFMNRQLPVSSARYQKDWTISGRYVFNPYLYMKLEQHFVDGTAIGLAGSDNPNLQPNMRMTMFKLGVSF
jgi:hypothetical protein